MDDQSGLVEAVAELLSSAGWGPITTAASAAEGIAAVERMRPDVAIVDLRLGRDDGVQLLHRFRGLRDPPAMVVLTALSTMENAIASVRAGARAFVPKGASPQDLLDAVAAVATGGGWMPHHLLGGVLTALLEPAPPTEWQTLVDGLTPREHEVLDLMVAGYDRPSIARQLNISLNTARTHTKNILAKLGVHSSLEAVSVALRAGVRPAEVA
ncbi:response regulator transcription factor [Aquihabitans sp. McL0605]|uniref:response regulator transcription factor n=1 Tax=Aquihabitans sp. McL0605 TaxID=3415671 RepID=UPI003CEA0E63